MLIGLFIVKPVPLSSSSSSARHGATIEGYDPIPSGDAAVFIGEAQVTLGPEVDTEADADSASLLSNEQELEPSLYQVPVSPSDLELKLPVDFHRERGVGDKDMLPDIHGKQLWLTPDFYLVFVIMGLCG